MNKKIKLCSRCNKPVVYTFAMKYKEYGCVECNLWWEMFNNLKEVDASSELIKELKNRQRKWKKDLTYIAGNCGGAECVETDLPIYRCNCKHHKFLKTYKPKYWRIK